MKNILCTFLLFLFSSPCFAHNYEDEFSTQNMLSSPQNGEVNLINTDDETLIDGLNQNGENINLNYENDDEDDSFDNNLFEDFKIFQMMGKNKEIKETTLLGKIWNANITRTDVPTFMLKDELTFDIDKGPISEIQIYGGHRGQISSVFNNSENTTNYKHLSTEIGIFGKLKNKNYRFKASYFPIPSSGKNYLESLFGDLYIVNTSIPHHMITAGYTRIQSGIEGGAGTYTLPFINRSQIARNFGNSRSISIKLNGDYNYADYSFAFGSSGRSLISAFPGTEFTGWLNLKPFGSTDKKFGKLTIGTGINTGHNRINYTVGSAYIGYKHKHLWTNFEVAIANGYNGSLGISNKKASGYAFTAGWKFNPHLQLIGRIDQFDPNRKISHDLKREYTVGLNWFIKGQAIRFILNYIFCDNQNTQDSHKIILATQILI